MNTSALTLPHSAAVLSGSAASKPPFMPIRAVSARTAVWSALLGVAAVAPMMVASSVFPLSDHSRTAFAAIMLSPGIGILKHVVIGPALEEIVFRGGALPLARRYMPLWAAVVSTSVLFGAIHFAAGGPTVCMATLMGIVLASLAVRFGSLVPALICHMAFNFTVGFIAAPSFDISAKLSEVPFGRSAAGAVGLILPMWWIAASLALAMAAVMFLRRAARSASN